MSHNLIPPFLLREAGVVVKDIPKMQVNDPTVSDHSVYFPRSDIRIPLALCGIFSYFPTRKPTPAQLEECDVLQLTPDGEWNPHSAAYARNEESCTDYTGNIVPKRDRVTILLSDIEEDPDMNSTMQVSAAETAWIDLQEDTLDRFTCGDDNVQRVPHMAGDPVLTVVELSDQLTVQHEIGTYKTSVGATEAWDEDYLFDALDHDTNSDHVELSDADINEMMACSTTATTTKGVSSEHLSNNLAHHATISGSHN
jgi:hypothetical protein